MSEQRGRTGERRYVGRVQSQRRTILTTLFGLAFFMGAATDKAPAQGESRPAATSPASATSRTSAMSAAPLPADPKDWPEGDFSAAGMTRRLNELQPLLEEILGSPFGAPIVVLPVSREAMGNVLLEESVLLMETIPGVGRGPLLRTALSLQSGLLGAAVFAKVDFTRGAIHVVQENFAERVDLPGLGSWVVSQPLLDSILVHEAVHVWQHRRRPFRAWFGPIQSPDEMQVLNSVAEGHADHVARRVNERLGRPQMIDRVRLAQGTFPRSVTDRSDPRTIAFLRAYQTAPYVEGERFLDALIAALGEGPAVARAFDRPPRTRIEISDAGLYARDDARVPDTAALAESLRLLFRARKDTASVMGLPAAVVADELAALGPEPAAEALRGFLAGTMLVVKPTKGALNPQCEVWVKAMLARDADAADRLMDGHLAAWGKSVAALGEGEGGTLVASSGSDVPRSEGVARIERRKFKPKKGAAHDSIGVFLREGSAFIELRANVPLESEESLLAIAGEALAILAKAPERGVASRPAPPAAPTASPQLVKGRVTYRRDRGQPASFRLMVWPSPTAPAPVAVEGKDGAFEVALADPAAARLGRIFIDDVMLFDLVGESLAPDAAGSVTLLMSKPDLFRVEIVDAATKLPVPYARIMKGRIGSASRSARQERAADPDGFEAPPLVAVEREYRSESSVADERGVVRLTGLKTERPRALYVRAAGYLEAPVPFGTEDSDQVRVELRPAGEAEIIVSGVQVPFGMSVRVRGPSGERPEKLSRASRDGAAETGSGRTMAIKLQGLAPGRWVADFRDDASPEFVRRTEFDVEAGRLAVHEVSMERPEGLDVAATFVVPLSWGDSRTLKVTLVAEDPGVNHLDEQFISVTPVKRQAVATFRDVPAGKYFIMIHLAMWEAPLEVTRESRTATFRLPEHRRVVVRLLAPEAAPLDAPLPTFSLRRRMPDTEGMFHHFGASADSAEDGRLVIRLPHGNVQLFVRPNVQELGPDPTISTPSKALQPDFATEVVSIKVSADGPEEVLVRLKPAGALTLVVKDRDGRTVPDALLMWMPVPDGLLLPNAEFEVRGSGASRSFYCGGLPAGPQTFSIHRLNSESVEFRTFTITPGQTLAEEVVLE